MQDLIAVTNVTIGSQQVQAVSARELYLGLGLASDQWSRWSIKNIVENGFFKQDVDFIKLDIMSSSNNGTVIKDFTITIDFAKHLAMMAKTEKAHDYRNYFLELEKKVKYGLVEPPANPFNLPMNYVEALEQLLSKSKEIQVLQPKAEALDRISGSAGSMTITDSAKHLDMPPSKLFAWLSENGWTYRRSGGKNWIAFQDKINSGLLEHKVTTVIKDNGEEKICEQVRLTPKGLAKLAEVTK